MTCSLCYVVSVTGPVTVGSVLVVDLFVVVEVLVFVVVLIHDVESVKCYGVDECGTCCHASAASKSGFMWALDGEVCIVTPVGYPVNTE